MRNLFLFVAFFLSLTTASAQFNRFKEIKERYPNEVGVILERSKALTISVQGDSLRSSAVVKETSLSLKDQQKSGAWGIFGSYFQQIEDLQLKTIINENGKTKEVKMPTPAKRRQNDNSIFFDDSYFYELSFPVRKEGNYESWTYKETYRDPKFLPVFYFYSDWLMDESTFIIKASKGIDLAWSVYNDSTHAVIFKKYNKGDYQYFEWSVKGFKPPQPEEDCPKITYFVPVVAYYVKSYITKGGQKKNVLASADDLYKEYVNTVSNLGSEPSPKLDSLVRTLVSESDVEIDKVRKIFYWVQDHIRYIAFEDGMRGRIPHQPNYIFEKRYGDCKDMASLLVQLLKIAGVKAFYTWIGTRDLPYKYSNIPTPIVDNHMIATYVDSNKNYYFLDATGNYTRLGLPSSMIQSKEAFIISAAGYEIHEVPQIPSELNYKKDSVIVSVKNKFLQGSGTAQLNGYEKIDASYSLDKANSDVRKDNLVQYVKKGSNKFFLDTFKISNLYDRDAALKIDYTFRIGDYVSQHGDEMYINLNLSKQFNNDLVASDRKLARENDFQLMYDETYVLNFPDNYDLSYLPPNSSFQSQTLDFDINYVVKGKQIILRTVVKQHVLMLTPSLFSDWNEAVAKLSKSYRETVIFKSSKK